MIPAETDDKQDAFVHCRKTENRRNRKLHFMDKQWNAPVTCNPMTLTTSHLKTSHPNSDDSPGVTRALRFSAAALRRSQASDAKLTNKDQLLRLCRGGDHHVLRLHEV